MSKNILKDFSGSCHWYMMVMIEVNGMRFNIITILDGLGDLIWKQAFINFSTPGAKFNLRFMPVTSIEMAGISKTWRFSYSTTGTPSREV
jgi:hypothetical protein